jgi:alpha-D-ribose 1-methylphosphonate 5-triphosphate synthase subunit PhnH
MSGVAMDITSAAEATGFADEVHDAQRVFRACLSASARPGTLVRVAPERIATPRGVGGIDIGPAMWSALLALTDDTTPVWWSAAPMRDMAEALRFCTGAPYVTQSGAAAFAACVAGAAVPSLAEFAAGTDAAPEKSCTVLIEVAALDRGTAFEWRGPGIANAARVAIDGLPTQFWAQWQANHAAFPRGVDVLFTCGADAVGLPRTTRVSRLVPV